MGKLSGAVAIGGGLVLGLDLVANVPDSPSPSGPAASVCALLLMLATYRLGRYRAASRHERPGDGSKRPAARAVTVLYLPPGPDDDDRLPGLAAGLGGVLLDVDVPEDVELPARRVVAAPPNVVSIRARASAVGPTSLD